MGLRTPQAGDVGYDVLGALDVVGAVELAKLGKDLIGYVFGKGKGVAASNVSTIQNRGALFDGVARGNPDVVKTVVNQSEDIEAAVNKMGVTIDDVAARSIPTPTDNVDDVSLPPSITDNAIDDVYKVCLLYTSPSPRDGLLSRMPSSA